jgi:hypothetical protein
MKEERNVFEELLIGRTADGVAETSDTLEKSTYLYLWNDVVKDGSGEVRMDKVWKDLPFEHKDNILKDLVVLDELENVESHSGDKAVLYKMREIDLMERMISGNIETTDAGFVIKIKKDGVESMEGFVTEDLARERHLQLAEDFDVEAPAPKRPRI